jgi:NAD(P)-dependent dehydrogenase (short-subunit alcohol dehydrogenase family)
VALRWSVEQVGDQSGKVVLITGANTGIGFAAAEALARRGATVLLGCRSAERAAARERILGRSPDADVRFVELDLADLASVEAAAAAVSSAVQRVDVLVNTPTSWRSTRDAPWTGSNGSLAPTISGTSRSPVTGCRCYSRHRAHGW